MRKQDLGGIYQRVKETMRPDSGNGGLIRHGATAVDDSYFLQRLLSRCILQFQVSGAIDKANNMFNSSLELFQHEVELRLQHLALYRLADTDPGFHRHRGRHRAGAQ